MIKSIDKSKQAKNCDYNSRFLKGGALIEDMRLLTRSWDNGLTESAVLENLLGKQTRARAMDTFRRVFLPRYVNGNPPGAWKIVRYLEERNLPLELLRPVYYWVTARTERLLYDFVTLELFHRGKSQNPRITSDETASWIIDQLQTCGKNWTETVSIKVARGMLATLRDFGILEGAVKKTIAPVYLPVESFAYLAFALSDEGITGEHLMDHSDWMLFLFPPSVVEHMFLEADRHGLLRYQAAGKIVRIEFPGQSFEDMADVIAARTN